MRGRFIFVLYVGVVVIKYIILTGKRLLDFACWDSLWDFDGDAYRNECTFYFDVGLSYCWIVAEDIGRRSDFLRKYSKKF